MIFYLCSHGHDIGAPSELECCPGCDRNGKPCAGLLTRYGPGSRKTLKVKAVA